MKNANNYYTSTMVHRLAQKLWLEVSLDHLIMITTYLIKFLIMITTYHKHVLIIGMK